MSTLNIHQHLKKLYHIRIDKDCISINQLVNHLATRGELCMVVLEKPLTENAHYHIAWYKEIPNVNAIRQFINDNALSTRKHMSSYYYVQEYKDELIKLLRYLCKDYKSSKPSEGLSEIVCNYTVHNPSSLCQQYHALQEEIKNERKETKKSLNQILNNAVEIVKQSNFAFPNREHVVIALLKSWPKERLYPSKFQMEIYMNTVYALLFKENEEFDKFLFIYKKVYE